MKKKCPLYDTCLLRIRYEMMSKGTETEKVYCLKDYKKCGKYMIENPRDIPKKLNIPKNKKK